MCLLVANCTQRLQLCFDGVYLSQQQQQQQQLHWQQDPSSCCWSQKPWPFSQDSHQLPEQLPQQVVQLLLWKVLVNKPSWQLLPPEHLQH